MGASSHIHVMWGQLRVGWAQRSVRNSRCLALPADGQGTATKVSAIVYVLRCMIVYQHTTSYININVTTASPVPLGRWEEWCHTSVVAAVVAHLITIDLESCSWLVQPRRHGQSCDHRRDPEARLTCRLQSQDLTTFVGVLSDAQETLKEHSNSSSLQRTGVPSPFMKSVV